MRIHTHQPEYLIRAHVLQRAFESDVHVVQDLVQFARRSKFHCGRIWLHDHEHLLTVPLKKPGRGETFVDLETDGSDWQEKHALTLEHAYRRAPHFADLETVIRVLLMKKYERYMQVSRLMTALAWTMLRVPAKLKYESGMEWIDGESGEREVWLTEKHGCTEYVCGIQSSWEPFLKEFAPLFKLRGIDVFLQDWKIDDYRRDGTILSLSFVDLVAWLGWTEARSLLNVKASSKVEL